jgi:toxin ParE1/3/4
MPYRHSPEAERDLREIWSYVADDASPERADRLLDAIFDRLEKLVDLPRIGRRRPEFGPDVRSFAVENHVIYDREQGELLVSRILHGRRDQAAAWQESPFRIQRDGRFGR